MASSAFLLIPTDDPAAGEDWNKLDRKSRIERLQKVRADLGERIRARLGVLQLEYMGGVGSWTVRTQTPTDRQTLIDKLEGLPVEVAPDDRFHEL